MRQVVQEVRSGDLEVVDVPRPTIGATEVLVAATNTVLSPGTERTARSLASANVLGKARARPDLVRQVAKKERTEGLGPTMRAVRSRLDERMPLGYSGVGVVVEVGEAVEGISPGQIVATGGAGHAELQVVSGRLAVPVPEGVAKEEAAFATIAAIGMHGLRLSEVGPGARICVVGLGLLGQLALRLGQAAGCDVVGIDVRRWAVERAEAAGTYALMERGEDTTRAILDWSRGLGVDAVLITAATRSSDPVRRSPALARDRGTLVVVGDVGLDLERTSLYQKELTLRFARSYGPGRYERTYEDWGVDYPIGYVRWTEGRNLETFLDLLARRRLAVGDLVTHRFPIEDAIKAYQLIEQNEQPFFGVQLTYQERSRRDRGPGRPLTPRQGGGSGIGLIGAGSFVRSTLLPSLKEAGFGRVVAVASRGGISAQQLASDVGIERVLDSAGDVIGDPDVDVAVVASPHDTHASLVVAALEAGKHVFCEKPLALTVDDLVTVVETWRASHGQLMVGFNRRHSPSVSAVRRHFDGSGRPLMVTYRVSAGELPSSHWYHDRRQGGRLLGEVCHFVDTCSAIVDSPVASVYAVGSGKGEVLLEEDLVVTLRYQDGSVATITFAAGGHPRTSKERVEVLGGGHSALIDDYRLVALDDRPGRRGRQDKGHVAQLKAFRAGLDGEGLTRFTETAIASSAATVAAAESLRTGTAVTPKLH